MKKLLLLFILGFILFSCDEDNEVEIQKVVEEKLIDSKIKYEIKEDRVILEYASVKPDEMDYSCVWNCEDAKVFINDGEKSKTFFVFPDSEHSRQVTVHARLKTESNSVSSTIEIPAFNDNLAIYGLGVLAKDRASNDVDYGCYLDQGTTGEFAGINCGPTTTTMAIKWYNKDFAGTPEDARSMFRPEGGWWYTSDIQKYLNHHNVPYFVNQIRDKSSLIDQIKAGNIAIICLDMYYISDEENPKEHIDKFYHTAKEGWGHFILIKGYRNTERGEYFEVYDPYSMGEKYITGELKGINRYYKVEDVIESTGLWWKYYIGITKDGNVKKKSSLNLEDIPDAKGR
ncbi:MAG: C39 family peptidase [Marinifilaceae bacterium]|jgi:hypothetical protein|nr:C39 family peptidase [Marinifilaceae bacterium]